MHFLALTLPAGSPARTLMRKFLSLHEANWCKFSRHCAQVVRKIDAIFVTVGIDRVLRRCGPGATGNAEGQYQY
jgi:hypothetical protein